jgi:LemA protein
MTGLIIFGVVAVVVLLFVVATYNKLVQLRNAVRNAFAQVEVQLKRRYDLIPNLVEAVKGYMSHERETLESVIKARAQAVSANQAAAADPSNAMAMQGLMSAESGLAGAMGRLLAVFEQYPNLKANDSVNRLMEELASTENRVAFARQAFNDGVMTYNTACEVFPAVLISRTFGFQNAAFFEVKSEAEKEAPKVSFEKK